ncbi:IS3 family transposase, partial [Corynebacterium belfantii]|uniref:IS3 family transposase n=1 Tax=Corynebacterium belfantii TaxID=2014537 RepID=UPI0018D2FE48
AFTADSLTKAIAACAPKPGWMMHTDQGFQYQHSTWRNLIHDNAVMENFFGHLKTEMYHGEVFGTVEEFTQAVEDYIQWYNT